MTWQRRDLAGGVTLYHFPTEKFKTVSVRVYLQAPLRAETVTLNAVVSQVLGRGCKGYPTLLELNRRLDALYGAELATGVGKQGDVQSVHVSLDIARDRYLPSGSRTLSGACELLSLVLTAPEGFRPDVVSQEKGNLARRIEGLINDKVRYATLRCVEEMFRGQPFALTALGRLEDLPAIEAPAAEAHYLQLLRHAPMVVFAVGGGQEVVDAVADALALTDRAPQPVGVGPAAAAPGQPRRVTERQAVTQGKLCLGYRTGVTLADADYPALLVYNGVLGGFPHSKLFRNVREKASLAYYASSRLEALKGVLLVSSGIEPARYEQALEIIERQVADMARGEIDAEELEFTLKGLANRLRASLDAPGALIDNAAEEALCGGLVPVADRLRQIEAVDRQDLVRAAEHVRLDTVYFLTAEG